MASSRHHSPSLQQLQEQLNEEDLWLNTATFPQGPNSPEGLAWRLNDLNHPRTPTTDDKRESPSTISANLLEFLTSTPPGKLSSMNNNGGGTMLNNRQQSMLKLRHSEQQFLAQQHNYNQSPPKSQQYLHDHIEHNHSLPDDYDSDLDNLVSTFTTPTTLAAAINDGQFHDVSDASLGVRPQLCYILATAPSSAASHLPPTSSILAVATPTSRHSPIQDSIVFPPPCYDSLPRSSSCAAATAVPPSIAIVSSSREKDRDDHDIAAGLYHEGNELPPPSTSSLPAEPPVVSQSAQTDRDLVAMADLLPGASGASSTSPLSLEDQQQPPVTPDSLPLCCYPPVYVDDLEDHVGWDTDYDVDSLTTTMGAAKID